MIKFKTIKYSVVCLFFITIFFSFVILKVSAQTPIIDISEEEDTFIPSPMPDNYDYYVISPGSSFPEIIHEGVTTTARYTSDLTNYFDNPTTVLDPGESLPSSLKSSDTRDSLNPFFDDEELPRAVRTSTDDEAIYTAKQLMTISLHMNYAFTFLAKDSVEYTLLINSSDPFYLDVDIKDDSAAGEVTFENTIFPYPGMTLSGIWKETLAVFPVDDMTVRITFEVDSNTLVSITPHKMGSQSSITIPVNNSFGAEIVQDIPNPLPSDQEITAEDLNKKIGFSLRQFKLPLVEGEYYEIYLFMNDLDPSTNQTAPFLLGENFQVISGNLNHNGLLVRATADTTLTLVLYSRGYTNQEYTIYLRGVAATSGTTELELNVNTTLVSGTLHLFTLDHPSMMAINYTGSSPTFNLYAESGIPEDPWVWVTNQGDFYRAPNDLYDAGLGGIEWIYIPAGNYALYPYTLGDEVMFHAVEVQALSPFLSLNMNQNSVVAFEIAESSIQFNRVNRVNVSTATRKNESITYEFSVVAKYNELITESVTSIAMGNRETSPGVWEAYDENNTDLFEFFPTRPKEIPIVVVKPDFAVNQSGSISSFSANLAITLSHPTNYYPLNSALMTRSYFRTGTIIPTSAVSGTGQFAVNDDFTTVNDQVLCIPVSMTPNHLYNLTLKLEGNHTSSGDLNSTGMWININGGNLGSIKVFNSETSDTTDTYRYINVLVLAVSPTSYLFADIRREDAGGGDLYNCTLDITIQQLSVNEMEYSLTDVQNWNPDRLDGEVRNKDFLFDEIKPAEFPSGGLDLSFLLLAGVVVAAAGAGVGAFYYFRVRRGG